MPPPPPCGSYALPRPVPACCAGDFAVLHPVPRVAKTCRGGSRQEGKNRYAQTRDVLEGTAIFPCCRPASWDHCCRCRRARPIRCGKERNRPHSIRQLRNILSTGTTVTGEPIRYPSGAPALITAVEITLQPGQQTDWHTHPVPLLGYILEGERPSITVRKGRASIARVTPWPRQ